MSTTIDHLNAIRDQHGTLNPELVADVAADPAHPLHAQVYDVPADQAARRYYVERARKLLQITYRPDPSKPVDLRAFVAIKGEDSPKSEYTPTTEALADPFTRELLLRQMKRDAQMFANRYRHLAEFAGTVAALIEGTSA